MGAYQRLRRLSTSGSFLETHAGLHSPSGKPVFLKRLQGPTPAPAQLAEFLRARRTSATPTLVEVGLLGEQLWLVVEGREGESLRSVMSALARASGFIAPNEGLAVVARVAAALGTLHARGVAHGDVNPSTVFLTGQGQVELHDSGVANALGSEGDLGPYRSEMGALSPEQLDGPAGPASDVFCLGLMLFELAVGRPLWSGPSPAHLCHAASTFGGLTRNRVAQVPEPWLTLLVTMLAVEPSARPTMEEVVAVLEQAVVQNGWDTGPDDIARLFARATPGRVSPFLPDPAAHPLTLTTVSGPTLTPPGGHPAQGPSAVVARIATRKMTREELAAVRVEAPAPAEAAELPLDLRVGHLLVERGKLTRHQLLAAVEAAEALGGSIGGFLLDDGALDEDTWVATTAELTRTPCVTARKVADTAPGPEALALVPPELARATRAVPLGLKGGTQLMVAMVDPMDARALEALKAAIAPRNLVAFRAGARALDEARARLYPGGGESAAASFSQLSDPLALLAPAPPPAAPAAHSELPARTIDALLGLAGQRGAQALALVKLAVGVARRLGASEAELALAGLASRAMVTAALAGGAAPHQVPRLAELQERIGFGTEADDFAEALHQFPARMPQQAAVRGVVLAFAFAAHAGEPRPGPSRLGGALGSFRGKLQLSAPLFEALAGELGTS